MLRPRLRRRLQTVAALAPAVLGAIALSEVGLFAVRRWVSPETLRASNDVVGNYLQTVGTIYAVLLAFVVYVVWTQFNGVDVVGVEAQRVGEGEAATRVGPSDQRERGIAAERARPGSAPWAISRRTALPRSRRRTSF